MAINIEWQVKPPVKGNEKEEKPKMFPRIIDSEIVCEQRLAELMAAHGSLSRGHAKAALNDLSEVMAELLSLNGFTVLSDTALGNSASIFIAPPSADL